MNTSSVLVQVNFLNFLTVSDKMMFRVLEFQEKRELHTKYTRTKRLISSWTLKEIKILLENMQ